MKNKLETIVSYVCALIFVQTLFFKFTGATESIWIFNTLGVEPWGRYLSGGVELVASLLLLKSSTRLFGALLGLMTMLGAIFSHLFILGVSVQNDGGLLFFLCLICFLSNLTIIFLRKNEIKWKEFGLGVFLFIPVIVEAKISYNDENDFGIHGYDPVSYYTLSSPQVGKKEFSFKFDGVVYLFSTEAHRALFMKTPEKYIPAYGGWCAYAMAEGEKVDIDPKTYKMINGKVYLFYNGVWGNTLIKWQADEKSLKIKADQSWEKIIK